MKKRIENEPKETTYVKEVNGEPVFTTFEAQRILDIKRGRFVEWMRGKYVPVGYQVPWGSGTKTVYTLFHLIQIEIFKRLVERGVSREEATHDVDRIVWEEFIDGPTDFLVVIPSIKFPADDSDFDNFDESHVDEINVDVSEIPIEAVESYVDESEIPFEEVEIYRPQIGRHIYIRRNCSENWLDEIDETDAIVLNVTRLIKEIELRV